MPSLDSNLRAQLGAFRGFHPTTPTLDANHWPVGYEAALYNHHKASLAVAFVPYDALEQLAIDYEPRTALDYSARPPSELGAYHVWQKLEQGCFDFDALVHTNRILGGNPKLRTGQTQSTRFRSGHRICYDCSVPAETFLHQWLEQFHDQSHGVPILARALWLYFDFLTAHPFVDGNGRVARVLLQAHLHESGLLSAPLLPIGPCLNINDRAYLNALWAWQQFGDANSYFGFMLSTIQKTKEVFQATEFSS